MSDISKRVAHLSPIKRALLELELEGRNNAAVDNQRDSVAIIGMGCRFPGGANNPEAFWRLLSEGVDAISEVPSDRWDVDAYYDPNPEAPGKMSTRWGGFLESVDQFDPHFFGISPREGALMDPQQRLLLEVSWEALENAGQAADKLSKSQTGVFVGISTNDYSQVQMKFGDVNQIDAYVGTGNALSVASGRLSYFLGLQGPCMSIDTACSSSLVAVHLAAQSLLRGECDLALAGGVNVMLSPEVTINFSKARMMAADGRCKTFDAAADGYVRGEGCGIIVLKLLSNALKDGDNILAVMRGASVNQDGRSGGLTVPNGLAQETLLRKTLASAGVKPNQVAYVEAHGTGTSLGDPIEVRALGAVFGEGRTNGDRLLIGSVKTNIGHLEAAAGVAGLIKVVLALQREIPPHIHLNVVNPHIPLDALPITITTRSTPWPAGKSPRIAGISSFGFSGTNAHVILEEPPKPQVATSESNRPYHLFCLSAKTEEALDELIVRYQDYLETTPEASLADICFTASAGRTHFDHRLAVVVRSLDELRNKLKDCHAAHKSPALLRNRIRRTDKSKIAFLFTEQDVSVASNGLNRFQTEATFRSALERYQLWRSWGIVPHAVMGHGLGEYIAACIAGVFSVEEALMLAVERSRLMEMSPTVTALDEFEKKAQSITFRSPQMRLISSLTGRIWKRNEIPDAEYWCRQIREPVLFQESMQALDEAGCNVFLEVRDQPALLNMGKECLTKDGLTWLPSSEKGKDDREVMLASLGSLYIKGANPNWDALSQPYQPHRLPLPTYPFQRERCWFSPKEKTPKEKTSIKKVSPTSEQSARLPRTAGIEMAKRTLQFGLMFFASNEDALVGNKYRLVVEAAKFADEHGFSSVWVPERHFTKFGCLYPNPAVLHAALARETKRIRLRAGSVVLPLHNPLRIAEEWAVVDNLSDGRVDLSFASGWHPNDFAFFPDKYGDRHGEMFSGIPQVQRLWRGETVKVTSGTGEEVEVRVYPTPVQRELPVWVTAAGNPETFRRAGEIGANVLTHLLDQGVEGLAGKIAIYREARAIHGHDPATGQVTVMLHTFIGEDVNRVHDQIREPFCEYLKSISHFLQDLAHSRNRNVAVTKLSKEELDESIHFLYERFAMTRALLGTAETCQPLVNELAAVGVDEVACLLDFGPETELILEHLPALLKLKEEVEQQSYEVKETVESVTIGDEDERPAIVTSRGTVAVDSSSEEKEKSGSRARVDDWIYRMQWEESAAVNGEKTKEGLRGRWLIFADQGGVGEQVGSRLREVGAECWVVKPREHYHYSATGEAEIDGGDVEQVSRLLEQVSGKESVSSNGQSALRGIIHLWSLDATPLEQTTSLKQFEEEVWRQTGSALHVMQGMAQSGVGARLWLVTRGVQAVGTAREEVAVEQAALWGLGRVCAMEHAELWGGLVDLDRRAPVEQSAAELLEVLSAGDGEDQVVMRGGRRYVARLRHAELDEVRQKQSIRLERGGAYLITGGLWGMGYEVARWLAERGAGQLVLLGRSALPEREQWQVLIGNETRVGQQLQKLRELEQLGVEVKYYAVDVGDEQQMQSWWKEYCESGGKRLRGVIHAASVWQDRSGEVLVRPLLRVNEKGLREVLHPKVSGGWVLERILGAEELDFYVCFSSGASLVGTAGLGNYAAASAFLDVLAEYRGSRGKAGLSINWGAIGEVGFGATAEGERVHAYWKDHGVERLRVTEVLAALEELITGEVSGQWGVMKVEWEQLAQRNPQVRDKRWTRYLLQSVSNGPKSSPSRTPTNGLITKIYSIKETEKRAELLENHFREQIATVLKLAPSKLDVHQSLNTLGFDSLMAIELRNKIELDLGVVLPVARLLEDPTVTTLAQVALELLTSKVPATSMPVVASVAGEEWVEGEL